MKFLITLALLFSTQQYAQAGTRDLAIFNTLINADAETEVFMSKEHLYVQNLRCQKVGRPAGYACEFHDASAQGGSGAEQRKGGKAAKKVFFMLAKLGALPLSHDNATFLEVYSVRCTQVHAGVMDGSEADRTDCYVEMHAPTADDAPNAEISE